MALSQVPIDVPNHLYIALSSITSPNFREFVLELGEFPSYFNRPPLKHWGRWEEIDRFLNGRFAERADFRLVIRTGRLHVNRATFQKRAKETFPLLTSRGCIAFETSDPRCQSPLAVIARTNSQPMIGTLWEFEVRRRPPLDAKSAPFHVPYSSTRPVTLNLISNIFCSDQHLLLVNMADSSLSYSLPRSGNPT